MTLFLLLYTLVICMALLALGYLAVGFVFASVCWLRSPTARAGHNTIGDFLVVTAAWPFFAWSFYKMGFGL